MAAYLENREALYLLESDEGLTVHRFPDAIMWDDSYRAFIMAQIDEWQGADQPDMPGEWDHLGSAEGTGKLAYGSTGPLHLGTMSREAIAEWAEAEREGTL